MQEALKLFSGSVERALDAVSDYLTDVHTEMERHLSVLEEAVQRAKDDVEQADADLSEAYSELQQAASDKEEAYSDLQDAIEEEEESDYDEDLEYDDFDDEDFDDFDY